jgi:Flp pilus assembly protein TadD
MDVYSFAREGLMLLFMAILVFLVYSNTIEGPFVFDDEPNIQDNPHIRLTKLTLEGITGAGIESLASSRPVANISFALNYYFDRYNVVGYHLVNILIHITAGILLYFFVKTTLRIPTLHSRYGSHRWIPFFTSCIWLVHPIQTQSVTYIVQRMNSMAAMFYVLSFLLYAKGRLAGGKRKKWALFAGCMFAGVLALGSKQTAATLPFFIFLYEWYFFQDLSWTWLKRHCWNFAAVLIVLALVVFMYLGLHPLETILSSYDHRDFTLTERVATQFRVVIFYISLLIFPHPSRLNLDYDFALSHSLFQPITTLFSMVSITGFMGLALYTATKNRLLSFCILWFSGNLVIESSVVGLEMIFEHRVYLPSMLVSLMVVTLAYRHTKHKSLIASALCLIVVTSSVWTYQRNSVWSDDVALWRDCVEKSPNKDRPHNNLGNALAKQGDLNEAIHHYSEALRINPNYVKAHNNLGNALAKQGDLNEAIHHFSEALKINPNYVPAHNNLGNALAKQGDLNEAIHHYSEALKINPNLSDTHNGLGIILHRRGNFDEAVAHFRQAVRIKPGYAEAYNHLGTALHMQGKFEEAVIHFSKALKIKPDYTAARSNLTLTLQEAAKSKQGSGILTAP